jgi:hypothetical protein
MLRAKSLNLSIEEMFCITEGELVDMIIERENDNYEYPLKATMADIEALMR